MTETCKTLSVNRNRTYHRFLKETLSPPLDLLAWLSEQKMYPKFYWQEEGLERAACGSILTLDSPPEFDADNDSSARFWGGHAFFSHLSEKDSLWKTFPRCQFFLPHYEIVSHAGKMEGITHSLNAPISEGIPLTPAFFSKSKSTLENPTHFPTSENWMTLIQDSLKQIQEAVFEKVVMARRSTQMSKESLNAFEILSQLKAKGAIRFAIQFSEEQTFIGATPERLFKRAGRTLFTEAIAGTRKRGKTDEEDLFLEKELLENPKEQREFAYVKTSIRNSLEPLCKVLTCEEEDSVVKTPNVQHLHNKFQGILREGVGDEEILKALHPTAAMGGLPRKSALEHLLHFEPFERGWYASPLGFISSAEAEFAVGIRSALVEKEKFHLFAGTGIVEGSIPEKEWEELNHKTSLWEKVIS